MQTCVLLGIAPTLIFFGTDQGSWFLIAGWHCIWNISDTETPHMFNSTEAHVARRSVVCVTMAVAGRRKGGLQRWIASNLQTSSTVCFWLGQGSGYLQSCFPPNNHGSCETFVMPLWVSKCPGGSKCQRHTRRLRLGRKTQQCALCHAEINGIWDVSSILWNYDELSESIQESFPV